MGSTVYTTEIQKMIGAISQDGVKAQGIRCRDEPPETVYGVVLEREEADHLLVPEQQEILQRSSRAQFGHPLPLHAVEKGTVRRFHIERLPAFRVRLVQPFQVIVAHVRSNVPSIA